METAVLSIDEIVPYWRNPRRISDEAVNAVAESISRYGYQQPILVDSENVIIAGHTRYSALRRLGVTEVQVIIARNLTPKQAKELRAIDNRVSEFTSWDFDKLVSELGDLDADMMYAFFPELTDQEQAQQNADEVLMVDVSPQHVPSTMTEFICPTCYHQWTMPVSRVDVMSGRLEMKEEQK
jgi:hypothetical protein